MTYKEKYNQCKSWQERATIMNLFHVLKCVEQKWKISDTASYFNCSIGLVSENLKLASRIEELREVPTRKLALEKIK